MSDTTEPKAATLAELKANFPMSTPEDREHMQEKGMTLLEAGKYVAETMQARLESRDDELSETKAKLTEAEQSATKRGVSPVGGKERSADAAEPTSGFDDPIAEVEQRAAQHQKNLNLSNAEAHARVMRDDPELRDAYVSAWNEKHEIPTAKNRHRAA